MSVSHDDSLEGLKAVILCGGLGTRMREETEFRPKPMVEIGNKPLLWHIMKGLSHYGIRDFILCLGYRGEVIRQYFLNYQALASDFTISLGPQRVIEYHNHHLEEEFNVTLVDTGQQTLTGGRIKRIERYVEGETFLVAYGDSLADVNIRALYDFHHSHDKDATVTVAHPISRWGNVELDDHDGSIRRFEEKLPDAGWISAGFFMFEPGIFDYLGGDGCTLEQEPMQRMVMEGEIAAYRHPGFFFGVDTYREYLHANQLWQENRAPWKIWK